MEYKIQKVKLKDVCKIEKGKIGITKAVKGEYPLVVTAEERLSHNEWHFNEPATIVPLVSSTGHGHASIKRLHYADGKYAVGNILATLIPIDHDYLNAKYLYVYLTINKEELLVSQMTGAANVTLTLTRLADVEIEIPDYATQLKVINRYEDSENFKNQMGSQIEVRSQLIENLRQQILNDAITGKLSERWRTENSDIESATKLLRKINAERGRLVKEGKIKKQKQLSPVSESEIPFVLPQGWVWCRFAEVLAYSNDSMRRGPFGSSIRKDMFVPRSDSATKVYEQKNAIYKDYRLGDYFIDLKDHPNLRSFLAEQGDIIISCAGTIGEAYILPKDAPNGVINQALLKVKPNINIIVPSYIIYIFQGFLQRKVNNDSYGSAMKNLGSVKYLKEELLIPLPPLVEQEHIVSQINYLLNKLDIIKEINVGNHETVELLNKVVFKKMFEE